MDEVTFSDLVGPEGPDDGWRAVPGDGGGVEEVVNTEGEVVTAAVVEADRSVLQWFEEEGSSVDVLDGAELIAVIDGEEIVGVVSTTVVRDALTSGPSVGLRSTLGWHDPELATRAIRPDGELAGQAGRPRPTRLIGRCGHLLETYRPQPPFGLCPDPTPPPHPFIPADDE